jgi:hypothetical protein
MEINMKYLKSVIRISIAVVVLATSTSLFAAKNSGVVGSLTMLNSETSPEVYSLSGSIYPSYGDQVFFDAAVEGRMARTSWLYVTVVCRQDDSVIFQSSNWTDFTFSMVDLNGQGLEWDGEPAECTANLIYRVEKGKEAVLQYLDEVSYTVH